MPEGEKAGNVYVDVYPNVSKFSTRLAAGLKATDKIGERIGRQIGENVSRHISASIAAGLRSTSSTSSSAPARAAGRRSGDDFSGEFDRTVRQKLAAAARALPPVRIGVAANEAEQKLRDLRLDLDRLSGKRIGVDISSAAALAQVDRIRVSLERLGTESADVQVRADTAAAITQLSAVSAAVAKVDGKDAKVDVKVDSGGAVAQLTAVGSASQIARISVGGLVGAGISIAPAIVPAAAAAVGAIAAIGPAAAAAAAGIGVIALGTVGVIGAVKAMSAAEDQAAAAQRSSTSSASGLASATDQVRSAKASLANTAASTAEQLRQADQRVASAEQDLADAQREYVRVQQTLTQARLDAKQALEDLSDQVIDNGLAQRRATYDLVDAQARLDEVQGDVSATQRQRDEAQLAYDEARQHADELGRRQERLTAQRDAAQRAGIDGSQQVLAAQESIAQAGSRVTEAEDRVAEARIASAETARQAAFALAQAQQSVVSAQRAVGAATIAAGAAGSAAMEKLRQAMEGLSPAGRDFATFLHGLGPEFTRLRQASEQGLLPGVQAGMTALLPVFPAIERSVSLISAALGDMFARMGTALAGPFWQQFFAQMTDVTVLFIQLAGPIMENLSVGLAGLLQAFAPLALVIGGWLVDLTAKFAEFTTGLSNSPQFKSFIDYVVTNLPLLGQLFANLFMMAVHLMVALAPLGEILLRALVSVTGFLASVDPAVLLYIGAAIAAIAGGVAIAVGAVVGGVAAIVGAVIAVVGVIVYAWNNVAWFHDGILSAFGAVGVAVMFLWQNVFMPAWQGIQLAISLAWAVMQVVFGLIQIQLKILGGVFSWLADAIIKPVWDTKIRPVFLAFGAIMSEYLVPAFKTAVAAISAAWETIRDATKVPIRFVVNTVLNNGLLAGYNKLAQLFGVKPDNVQIPLPAGFATGGLITGPGTGTSDSILARVTGGPTIRVSNGEYVIPAHVVARLGVGFFDALSGKSQARYPGDGSGGLAFAAGGLLDFAGDLWDAVSDPVKLVATPVNRLIERIPGGPWVGDVAAGTVHKLVDGLLGWIRGYGGDSGNVGKTRAFLLAQKRKPYVWAAAGPDGYDCSGLVSAAWNVMHGRNPYSHTFSTSNQAGFFPKVGHGVFTAGWANPGERGGGSVGHTAGLLAGMGFESRGGDGVVIGSGTTSVDSFAHVGTFDAGGWLKPGLTLAYNGTGRDEMILTADDVDGLRGSSSGHTYNIYPQKAVFNPDDLKSMVDARDALDRVGRLG